MASWDNLWPSFGFVWLFLVMKITLKEDVFLLANVYEAQVFASMFTLEEDENDKMV